MPRVAGEEGRVREVLTAGALRAPLNALDALDADVVTALRWDGDTSALLPGELPAAVGRYAATERSQKAASALIFKVSERRITKNASNNSFP